MHGLALRARSWQISRCCLSWSCRWYLVGPFTVALDVRPGSQTMRRADSALFTPATTAYCASNRNYRANLTLALCPRPCGCFWFTGIYTPGRSRLRDSLSVCERETKEAARSLHCYLTFFCYRTCSLGHSTCKARVVICSHLPRIDLRFRANSTQFFHLLADQIYATYGRNLVEIILQLLNFSSFRNKLRRGS